MGVPKTLTQAAVASELLAQDPSVRWAFDFLWCPWEAAKKGRNVGYFVINFSDARDADAFQARWSGKVFCKHGTLKRHLFIKPASLQGIVRNLEYCRQKQGACLVGAGLTAVFSEGQGRVPLPGTVPLDATALGASAWAAAAGPGGLLFTEDSSQPAPTSEPSDQTPTLSHGTLRLRPESEEDVRASLLMSTQDEARLQDGQPVLAWLVLGGAEFTPIQSEGGPVDSGWGANAVT